MRLQSTKLSHQGLILIAVPLLFEFAFVISLAYLLERADWEMQREEHAREVILLVYSLNRQAVDATSFLGEYTLSGQPAPADAYKQTVADIRSECETLKTLVADEPASLEAARRCEALNNEQLKALEQMYGSLRASQRLAALRTMARMGTLRRQGRAALDEMQKPYLAIQQASPAMRENTRVQIRLVLLGGLVLSLFVALALARHFSGRTIKRLEVLMDNSRNLATGGKLLPPLDGDDEIAQLDRVFNEMAAALAEAARKEREAAASAQANEARVQLILENLPVGVLTVREDAQIDFSNAVMQQMMGSDASDLAGMKLPSLFVTGSQAADQTDFLAALSLVVGKLSELQIRRANGETLPVEVSLTQLNTLERSQYLIMMIDVTEKQEVLRLKRDFVAMVSHELRTPLTSVQTFLESFSAGTYGSVSERLGLKLSMAERNVGRLMELINNLLDIERLEAREIGHCEDGVAIGAVLEAALDSVSDFAEKQGIAIDAGGVCPDVTMRADRDLIVQVLVNLLANALKFSPSGSSIEITAEAVENLVKIQVIDHGRGIPERFRKRIFERFEQVQSSDATEKGGSGLGLAICKTIVEKHGGTIGVDSEEGSGSTFWFFIPQAKSGNAAIQAETSNAL